MIRGNKPRELGSCSSCHVASEVNGRPLPAVHVCPRVTRKPLNPLPWGCGPPAASSPAPALHRDTSQQAPAVLPGQDPHSPDSLRGIRDHPCPPSLPLSPALPRAPDALREAAPCFPGRQPSSVQVFVYTAAQPEPIIPLPAPHALCSLRPDLPASGPCACGGSWMPALMPVPGLRFLLAHASFCSTVTYQNIMSPPVLPCCHFVLAPCSVAFVALTAV